MPLPVRPNLEWSWEIPESIVSSAKDQKALVEEIDKALLLWSQTVGIPYRCLVRVAGRGKERPRIVLRMRASRHTVKRLAFKDARFRELPPQQSYDI